MSSQNAVPTTLFPRGAETCETTAGTRVVARASTPEAERTALVEGALLVDRSWRSLLRIGGEDRVRFVNGLMTCDLKRLAPGDGAYGFFTDPKGRVLADAVVLATEDALYVDVPSWRAEPLIEHLTKYIITDRVEPSLAPVRSILLTGPLVPDLLSELVGSDLSAPWAHLESAVDGVEVRIADERRIGPPAFSLWIVEEEAEALFERLAARATVGGWEAVDAARVEAGIPWFGVDFDEENIPQETSLQSAVSFEKGCYLGQEVVARVHFLGKASRTLHPVRFRSQMPVPAGAELAAGGRRQGTLKSVTALVGEAGFAGIASIDRRATESAESLSLSDGQPVDVLDVDGL